MKPVFRRAEVRELDRRATAEASVLNTARVSDRGVSQLVVSDER